MEPGLTPVEQEIRDDIASRPLIVETLPDGTHVFEIPQLSWEQRARLAEEKLEALIAGLDSEEAFNQLLIWNPIANAIAHIAIRLHEDSRDE